MVERPRVGIVVPVHDGRRFLSKALRSAFDQRYRPIDVIVVVDGSTDDSAVIARSFDDVSVVTQPHLGVSAARNRGLEAVKADLITFIDADDEMAADGLTKQVAFMVSHPEIGFVFGHSDVGLEQGISRPGWVRAPLGHTDPVPMASALFRSSLLEEVGGFDPSRRQGEWFELHSRLVEAGMEVAVIEDTVVRYRVHGANRSDPAEFQAGMFRSLKAKLDRRRASDGGQAS